MERGSDKHGARMDDALKHEVDGLVHAGRDTRAEPWKSAEPSGEDQPDVDRNPGGDLQGGVPDGMSHDDVELRSEIAAALGKEVYPAVRARLIDKALEMNAPTRVVETLKQLPSGREFHNVQDVMTALRAGVETRRF